MNQIRSNHLGLYSKITRTNIQYLELKKLGLNQIRSNQLGVYATMKSARIKSAKKQKKQMTI